MIEIYWIEMLDGINFLLILTGVIILIVAAIMIAMSFGKKYEDDLALRKSGIKLLFLSLVIFIICALIPNTGQAYRIYGVSATINHYIKDNEEAKQSPKISNKVVNKWVDDYEAEQLPDKGFKVVNKWVDDYLEEESIK